ncbi:MAG: DUF1549 domain-containing protein, partial [Gemmataceae bacterium]|nr:DUF1549 domain-containing protein [Gemmataceae bacterium]
MRYASVLLVAAVMAPLTRAQQKVDFARDVRPILSNHCFKCHGPAKQEAGLRLDDRNIALKRQRIVPGDPAASKVLQRVLSTDSEERMPPPGAGEPLTSDQVATLRHWIAQGADYAPHWAFIRPQRVAPPTVKHATWNGHPIDRFIADRLEKAGLTPSPEADPATLIRRLSLDLTGLLPTPREVDDFVQRYTASNRRDAVYEELVD